jgi:UDP:flavonoid glycosyltransferase YjiC (YdhE family)
MPACDLVVCHGGHGTLARALASGCAVLIVPAAGDMNESAARVEWAGVGVRLPRRMVWPRAIGLAVGRALARPQLRAQARELQAWAAAKDGAQRAADHVEAFVRGGGSGSSAPSAAAASR